jgi:osmotically-inducible protein OsmY
MRAQLQQYPSLNAPNTVRVQVLNGTAYLDGQVDTDNERELAAAVAAHVAGIRRVVNSIALSYAGR